jgi:large subunit ribosomal protein L15
MIRKSKKITKLRGSRTCGYGAAKKHRGAGHKGGKGLAGVAKHRWIHTVKYMPDHIGKYGFKRHSSLIKELKVINLGQLDEIVSKNKESFEVEDGKVVIDITTLEYEKVLGKGKITCPMIIKAVEFSESAKEKIESAGGEFVEL